MQGYQHKTLLQPCRQRGGPVLRHLMRACLLCLCLLRAAAEKGALSAAGRFEEVKATIEAPVETAIQGLPVPGVQDELQQVFATCCMTSATCAAARLVSVHVGGCG